MSIAELPVATKPHVEPPPAPTRFRYTLDAFETAERQNVFGNTQVELLFGEVFEMPEMSPLHAVMVAIVNRLLITTLFDFKYHVRPQLPVRVPPHSRPQPDLAIVWGEPTDYLTQHPATAVAMIEVCVSSETNDRVLKTRLYAEANVPQYLIVFPTERLIELYTDPVTLAGEARYGTMRTFTDTDRLPLLHALVPDVAVADLLPPAAPAA